MCLHLSVLTVIFHRCSHSSSFEMCCKILDAAVGSLWADNIAVSSANVNVSVSLVVGIYNVYSAYKKGPKTLQISKFRKLKKIMIACMNSLNEIINLRCKVVKINTMVFFACFISNFEIRQIDGSPKPSVNMALNIMVNILTALGGSSLMSFPLIKS